MTHGDIAALPLDEVVCGCDGFGIGEGCCGWLLFFLGLNDYCCRVSGVNPLEERG